MPINCVLIRFFNISLLINPVDRKGGGGSRTTKTAEQRQGVHMYTAVQERTIFVATWFFIGPFRTSVACTKEGRNWNTNQGESVAKLVRDIVSRLLYSVKDMDTDCKGLYLIRHISWSLNCQLFPANGKSFTLKISIFGTTDSAKDQWIFTSNWISHDLVEINFLHPRIKTFYWQVNRMSCDRVRIKRV